MLDGLKIVSKVENLPDVADPTWDKKSWPELLIKTGHEIVGQMQAVLDAMVDDKPGETSNIDAPMELFVENIKSWLQCTQLIRVLATGEEGVETITVGEQTFPVVGHPVVLAIIKRLVERGEGADFMEKLASIAAQDQQGPGQYL